MSDENFTKKELEFIQRIELEDVVVDSHGVKIRYKARQLFIAFIICHEGELDLCLSLKKKGIIKSHNFIDDYLEVILTEKGRLLNQLLKND